MTPDQLRELADALDRIARTHAMIAPDESETQHRAADYLRACADAQPVAYRQWNSDAGYWYYGDASCAEKDDELLYTRPAPAVPTIEERGPWSAGQDKQQAWEQRVWIESDDFAYDVRLYVNGNFESHDQRFAYAQEIARRLVPQAEPKREPVSDSRPCTCHPDDSPPVPCARKYALSECRAASGEPTEAQIKARDALLDFISENGTASEGVQHYLDRYVRAALAAKE